MENEKNKNPHHNKLNDSQKEKLKEFEDKKRKSLNNNETINK
jgi:hypothetical protein